MPAKKYRVRLSEEERQELKGLVSKGRGAAYKQTHARILLLSDESQGEGGMKDEDVAPVAPDRGCHGRTGAPALRGGRN